MRDVASSDLVRVMVSACLESACQRLPIAESGCAAHLTDRMGCCETLRGRSQSHRSAEYLKIA